MNDRGYVSIKFYWWTLKFEFHLISMCHKISFSFWFFPTILECKIFLHSRVIKKQSAGWMWLVGCNLPNSAVGHQFHEGRKLPDFIQHCTQHTIKCSVHIWWMNEWYTLISQKSDDGNVFSPLWATILDITRVSVFSGGAVNNDVCPGQTRVHGDPSVPHQGDDITVTAGHRLCPTCVSVTDFSHNF